MYHRVLPDLPTVFNEPGLTVKASTLEMHLEEVAKAYHVVPLETLLQHMENQQGLCSITFDDGWMDTYTIAFPILNKYKVPATVFVPTDLIGQKNCFWFDLVIDLANKSCDKNRQNKFLIYFMNVCSDWKPTGFNNESVCALIAHMKLLPSNDLDEIIFTAYKMLGQEMENSTNIINWEQMAKMGKYDISFAPHGLRHYILPTLKRESKRDEIFKPLQKMKEMGINATPIFSYPNGNWDTESLTLIREAGYIGAVTTKLGYNGKETNPFLMKRIDMHESSSNTPSLFWFRIFQAMLAGQESQS